MEGALEARKKEKQRHSITDRKKKDKKYKPAGLQVLPGDYTLVFFFNEYSDTCNLSIKQDPKSTRTAVELAQVFQLKKEHQEQYKLVVKQVDKLKAIKNSISEVNGMLKFLPDSLADSLRKEGNGLDDSVSILLDEFFLPEGFKGYDHVTVTLSARLNRISGYLNSENTLETGTLEIAILDFKKYYKPVNLRMNNLFEKQWVDYQSKIESFKFEYFKAFKELEK